MKKSALHLTKYTLYRTLNDLASHVELLKAAGELVRQSGGSPKTDGRQTIQQGSAASPQIPLPLASSDPALDLTHLSPESWARPSPVEQFPINPEPAIINATALPTPLTLENVKIDPRTAQRLFKV
jgi:hypothetical protein